MDLRTGRFIQRLMARPQAIEGLRMSYAAERRQLLRVFRPEVK